MRLDEAAAIKVGADDVAAVYVGTTLVWPTGPPPDPVGDLLAEAVWYIDADEHDGNTSVENLGTGGSAMDGTESGTIAFLTPDDIPFFQYFGLAASHINTTDKAALDLSSFDIRCRIRLSDWTPATSVPLVSKYGSSASNRSYLFRVVGTADGTPGLLQLKIRENGTATEYSYDSTAAVSFSDGDRAWIRVTRDSASGNVLFYTAADALNDPSSWTQLGTTVAGQTGSLTNSTDLLYIGAAEGGGVVAPTGLKVYEVLIRNAASAGTVVADMCAADAPERGTWTDGALANTWTVTRPATGQAVALVDRKMWYFDAVDDYIEIADHADLDIDAGDSTAIFGVVRWQNSLTSTRIIVAKRTTSGAGWTLFGSNTDDPQFNFAPGGTSDVTTGIDMSGRMAVIGGQVDLAGTDEAFVWADGVSSSANSVTDGSAANTSVMRVASLAGTPGSFGRYEMVAAGKFNRALTNSEWVLLHRYFASRAGIAPNAAVALTIPTYDASGQAMHPSVWDFGTTWNGYRYWMAMTPFPASDDDFENPSIVASNDGITWAEPAGITNPIAAFPGGSGYNADPELVYDDDNDLLVCIYSEYDGTTNKTWFARTSADGVTWSNEITLFTTAVATENPLSVCVRKTDTNEWTMWYVNEVGTPNTWRKRTSTTATGTYGSATTLTMTAAPPGLEYWHAGVFIDDDGIYRCIMNVTNIGSTTTQRRNLLASSTDGDVWVLRRQPVIWLGNGGRWDDGRIYRATAIQTGDTCRMWYSANDGTNWGTGYTEFPMSAFPTP